MSFMLQLAAIVDHVTSRSSSWWIPGSLFIQHNDSVLGVESCIRVFSQNTTEVPYGTLSIMADFNLSPIKSLNRVPIVVRNTLLGFFETYEDMYEDYNRDTLRMKRLIIMGLVLVVGPLRRRLSSNKPEKKSHASHVPKSKKDKRQKTGKLSLRNTWLKG
ncbi:hypothetical protein RCL_jg21549.t1 [Rhizophagus clarus]|uniref:Uncharacterized protein n=1 Tax=Rhizophagus clarus TaxID=94130 RepID=A0A8H3QF91_9GLOM|nr:hypothetical protein RCL_jg21549.t1 [Rhizophagus clarus]